MRVPQTVLAILDRGRCEGPNYFLPPGQLDRKDYEAVNKVLTLAGGKWTRKVAAHVFANDAADALDPILLTGEVADAKKELQAFYTPEALAADVVAAADIGFGMTVLEPSAGEGALARLARDATDGQPGSLRCVEVHPSLCGLLREMVDPDTVCADFLMTTSADLGGPFDRVVMNPPFSKQQDARHVLHAYGMLKPGGKLVAIMSASVEYRETDLYAQVRALAANFGSIRRLPDGSFKESGTSVNSVIVELRKPAMGLKAAA